MLVSNVDVVLDSMIATMDETVEEDFKATCVAFFLNMLPLSYSAVACNVKNQTLDPYAVDLLVDLQVNSVATDSTITIDAFEQKLVDVLTTGGAELVTKLKESNSATAFQYLQFVNVTTEVAEADETVLDQDFVASSGPVSAPILVLPNEPVTSGSTEVKPTTEPVTSGSTEVKPTKEPATNGSAEVKPTKEPVTSGGTEVSKGNVSQPAVSTTNPSTAPSTAPSASPSVTSKGMNMRRLR